MTDKTEEMGHRAFSDAAPSHFLSTIPGNSMADVRLILPVPAEQGAETLPETAQRHYAVSNQNRWSRTSFTFRDLTGDTWCELTFQLAWNPEEKSRLVHDFAVIGVDFMTEDGSSIDFSHVPGLSKTAIDPHSIPVPGPGSFDTGRDLHCAVVRCSFLVPSPARQIGVTIRSWRNSHPFTVIDPQLKQRAPSQLHPTLEEPDAARAGSRRAWLPLNTEPAWFRYGVVPGQPLLVRGQLINAGSEGGAFARVLFRDAKGALLPPPDGIPVSPALGAFIDIPVHRQTRRFTLELPAPSQAATVEVGFQVWRDESFLELVTPLEVSLGADLLLENILGEHLMGARDFLSEALARLEESPSATVRQPKDLIDDGSLAALFTYHDKLRALQRGDASAIAGSALILGGQRPWTLPEAPEWTEDPFRSTAWRMEYQSLCWLMDLAGSVESGGLQRATELAVSWSRANPWGQPRDALSAYPSLTAARAEVFLNLLALNVSQKGGADIGKQETLLAEAVRHGFALAEILGQNLFSLSIIQIRTACALLSLARAVPLFPLAGHWESVALHQLRNAFEQSIAADGSSTEPSFHVRLEMVSLGIILAQNLESTEEAQELRKLLIPRLTQCLRLAVAVTDPAGMLPAFGDTLHLHHASWLRRLISIHGRWLLADRALAEELSYPTGPRMFVSGSAGVAAFRNYERKPGWSYLCTSFHEQGFENGHRDFTSFVYTAQGVEWIVDAGGSSLHEAGPVRHYLLSSRAHNAALPDGREQSAGQGWIEASLSLDEASIVRIGTNVHGPDYDHARIFVCLKDLSAIGVFDSFKSHRPELTVEGLLHFKDDIAVALANAQLAIGFHKRERLRMAPYVLAGQFNGLELQNGRSDRPGALDGFVFDRAGELHPANVLRYRFSGSGHVCGGIILGLTLQAQNRIVELIASQEVKDLLV